ncbi:hemagglutinin repeat-containing protein [Paraburkholderia pallida]|uniref:hemagglutinin repeat-containing protein n=1 Tax=Paraburkholderia pallida TaxID=2547399 RepID=UPI001E6435F1|nr:hemagglutinin repeat-containing protein [Paraburkholderia pallida]
MTTGNALNVTGSTLHAGNDVNMAGKSFTISSAYDTASQSEQQQYRSAGVTVGLTNPVVAAVQTGKQMASAAQHVGGDARLTALAAVTTGLAAKNLYDAVGTDPVKAASTVGINVSVGASKSDSQHQMQSSTAVGSTVEAGRNVTIAAAGAGTNSHIDVTGSTISAGGNALLAAEGDVNLRAAQSTSSQHGTSSGASAGVGVTFSMGSQSGLSFTASASGSRGHEDGDSSTWTNTHVTAGDKLAISSGGDTNIAGAVAPGKQVIADVGGNLNIESLQDVTHYDSKSQSAGVGVSVCVPPLCAGSSSVSGSIGQTKMNSDYASVAEQSGIKAGDVGFDVRVKGNTDLKGGVIASTADAANNALTTGTLTYSYIENHANYDASQVALSGGYSFGGGSANGDKSSIGKDQKGRADNVNPVPGTTLPESGGLSIAPPVAIAASGDAASTTRSGISTGTVTVTDDAKQQALTGQSAADIVANLNRDTSDTGGALSPIFDKEKIEAGFEITSQLVNQVGTFVANRAAEADAAKEAANDPNLSAEQRAAAQQEADELTAEWGPGGTYRQVATALTVAAGGNVTGGAGQFAQAGLINYVQQQGAEYLGKLVADGTLTEGSPTHAALHGIVACAGAAASSQSCGAGAMGAATSSLLTNLFTDNPNESAQERNLVRTGRVRRLLVLSNQ